MSTLLAPLRPVLARFDPERAHRVVLAALACRDRIRPPRPAVHDRRLRRRVLGIDFPSPIGLAAGFDKDGRAPHSWAAFGFGFAELGTVTPQPQDGNPRPRLFRLPAERAAINRMGFNNEGVARCVRRLAEARARAPLAIPVGVNIGINKNGADPARDYPALAAAASAVADYLVMNVSSPNTPGLRALQDPAQLDALLARTVDRARVPLLVKLAPDLADEAVVELVALAIRRGVAGLILANTALARPLTALQGKHRDEAGGLSGRPIAKRARALLAVAVAARGAAPLVLVSCGGLETGVDAADRLAAGADLLQLYTGFAYDGPALLSRLERGILDAPGGSPAPDGGRAQNTGATRAVPA